MLFKEVCTNSGLFVCISFVYPLIVFPKYGVEIGNDNNSGGYLDTEETPALFASCYDCQSLGKYTSLILSNLGKTPPLNYAG